MARPVSVNVAEVATRANVSIASVSRVLNNQNGVSEKLRSKIRAILEDDGKYSSHISERGIKLAVIIEMDKPHVSTYTSSLLTGIADYALHNSIDISTVFVQSADKAQTDFLRILRERHCDGVILMFSSTLNNDQLAQLIAAKMAVMVLNGRCEHPKGGYLYTDPNAGMTLLLNHLAHLGHHDIAFLAGPQQGDFDNAQRVTVFKDHLKAAGHKRIDALLAEHQPTRVAQEAGYRQAMEILKRYPKVTAMIANNDEMAYGAMLACHEAGRNVPNEISVVGFDDYPGSQYTVPPLTTVRQHLTEVGYQSVEAIYEYVCGTQKKLPRKILRPELIVRGSTASVNKS
jgi:DNA-binding LacI/PurR family transcriptional regulator